MSGLATVTKFEFVRTIRKRSFWIRTLSIPLLIGAVLTLSIFSNKAADQADEQSKQSEFTIAVLDQSGYLAQDVLAASKAKVVTDRDAGVTLVKTGQVDAFFYYPANMPQQPVQVYAKDVGLVDNGKYEAVAQSLLQAGLVQKLGGGQSVTLLLHAPPATVVTYDQGEVAKGFGRAVAPGIFLILFYSVIVLLGNQMLTSTTEEKENRVIEMMLTSVSAKTIIVGKIISLFALGFIQIAAMLTPVLIAYFGFRSQLHIQSFDFGQISFAPLPIVTGAAIFIGGLILFTGILVAIGSAVPTAKEAGGYFAFAMILMFVPFYALGAIISSPEQLVVKVMTYFPLTAPITLMLRNAAGNLAPYEATISLVILYATGALVMVLAIRIFRFGSLEYARKLSLKEVLTRRA